MKKIVFFILMVLFFYKKINAQNPIPLSLVVEEQDPISQDWEMIRRHDYTYNQNQNLISDLGVQQASIGLGTEPYKRIFKYDSFDNLIEEVYWYFNSDESRFDTSFYRTYDYDENRNITKELFYDFFGSRYINEYSYDSDGCLSKHEYKVEEILIPSGQSSWVTYERTDYSKNSDCQIISEEISTILNSTIRNEYSYDINGFLINKKEYVESSFPGSWILTKDSHFENDNLGRPILVAISNYPYQSTMPDFLIKKTYQYHEDNPEYTFLLEEQFEVAMNGPWVPILKEEYIIHNKEGRIPTLYEYYFYSSLKNYLWSTKTDYENDADGFLISKKKDDKFFENDTLMNHIVNQHSYTNRCDGALHVELIENLVNLDICFPNQELIPKLRETYFYGIPASCETQVEDFSIKTFPNPTKDIININSELFYYADSEIRLYSSSGQLVFEASSLISLEYQIDLSYLPNGSYILQIENKNLDEKLSSKIILSK